MTLPTSVEHLQKLTEVLAHETMPPIFDRFPLKRLLIRWRSTVDQITSGQESTDRESTYTLLITLEDVMV